MKLYTTLLFLVFSLFYLTHPISATSDGDGWSWGGDDNDNNTPDSPPKPTSRPTTSRPTKRSTIRPTTPHNGNIDCTKKCPRTPEYNPVCGTDNITYRNVATLKCTQNCGRNTDVMHLGKCQEAPASSSSRPTTLKPSSRVEACVKGCPKLPQYNPMCGTDGITYNNDGLLSCAKNCGKSVDFEYGGKCADNPQPSTSSEVPPPTNNPRPPTSRPKPPTSRPRPTSTTEESPFDLDGIIFKECLNGCSSTLEFKPVCGSDGVTYANRAVFNCQIKCGKKIEVSSNGKCPSSGGSTNPKLNRGQAACLKNCPNLPQWNPICGTNNQTYKNDFLLRCAQKCGVDVKMSYSGSCPKP